MKWYQCWGSTPLCVLGRVWARNADTAVREYNLDVPPTGVRAIVARPEVMTRRETDVPTKPLLALRGAVALWVP